VPGIDSFLNWLTPLAAVGAGVVAGVFYAFSTFVMKALSRLPPGEGAAAMRSINVAVINPLFLGLFLGTAVVCAATATGALLQWDRAGSGWLLAGSAFYLIGVFAVTLLFNVPLNDALATAQPDHRAPQWTDYLTRWTTWNHVRTLAGIAAAVALTLATRR
jgi:uncharacterized membrane protein